MFSLGVIFILLEGFIIGGNDLDSILVVKDVNYISVEWYFI